MNIDMTLKEFHGGKSFKIKCNLCFTRFLIKMLDKKDS